ncbi:MAG: hypothetical protein J5562_01130 [Clostridia bacterium]|nr:hypothetical protein [Clostridia bacterium]
MQIIIQKIVSLFTAVIMFLVPAANIPKAEIDKSAFNTDYTYVFVHGLSGWGSYAFYYDIFPYWGILGGDLMKYLNARGIDCAAASVAPSDSTWDRVCELYAQLTGTRVDYGKEHSERCGHDRYGTDYSKKPLIDKWDSENKINLFGHSFGGATIRMLATLMAYGSGEEQAVTDENEISGLFTGGKEDWIYSITTLASPHNGTTAYLVGHGVEDNGGTIPEVLETKVMFFASRENSDGRIFEDSASYDMDIDGAAHLNEKIKTVPGIYYFSYACSMSHQDEDGKWVADTDGMEPLFVNSAKLIVKYTGVTPEGTVLDESWQENDGLVNTISAKAPFNAPQKEYEAGSVKPGEWNIMPVYHGDHMSLQGGLLMTNNVRPFYIEHITMINSL